MRKADANLMKEINLNLVRQAMRREETATKPQLAAWTKLSVVTVNALVKELHDRGEVFEDATAASSGGRPALTYRYNYDYSLALVMHIKESGGQELVASAIVNLENRILQQEQYVSPVFEWQKFYETIERLLGAYPSVKIIGIGIPGQVVNGEITVTSHRELTGYRVMEEIERQFGIPVLIENDVNAAIGGYCAGHNEGLEGCVAGIYFPGKYPPGMGICLDGNIVKGKNGMAGEIKFLPLELDWYGPLDRQTFAEAVCVIIRCVNAIIAPDKVVLYQDRLESEDWERAWAAYRLEHPMPTYPEVVVQDTFQLDFEAGMRWLTLRELEPALRHVDS